MFNIILNGTKRSKCIVSCDLYLQNVFQLSCPSSVEHMYNNSIIYYTYCIFRSDRDWFPSAIGCNRLVQVLEKSLSIFMNLLINNFVLMCHTIFLRKTTQSDNSI